MSEPVAKMRVGMTAIWEVDGGLYYQAGLAIDADGCPSAYHPPTVARPNSGRPPGLDDLRNAGTPAIHEHLDEAGKMIGQLAIYWQNPPEPRRVGQVILPANWFGLATDDGRPTGRPVIQGPGDPAPGFYVSQTALGDPSFPTTSPRRYVDSLTVPYVSVPSTMLNVVAIGDVGVVFYGGAQSSVIVADVGPPRRIGEGSIALANELGLFRGNVNAGHDEPDLLYLLFPGTAATPKWPRSHDDIDRVAMAKLGAWGGVARARTFVPSLRSRA